MLAPAYVMCKIDEVTPGFCNRGSECACVCVCVCAYACVCAIVAIVAEVVISTVVCLPMK